MNFGVLDSFREPSEAIVPESIEIMETHCFTNSFHGCCYQFHGNILVAERLCKKSSVFEAYAPKTLETMISMHVVKGAS